MESVCTCILLCMQIPDMMSFSDAVHTWLRSPNQSIWWDLQENLQTCVMALTHLCSCTDHHIPSSDFNVQTQLIIYGGRSTGDLKGHTCNPRYPELVSDILKLKFFLIKMRTLGCNWKWNYEHSDTVTEPSDEANFLHVIWLILILTLSVKRICFLLRTRSWWKN